MTCDVLHDQVIVLSVGRVIEQGKPSHNVALLHSAAVACDMLPNYTAVTCDIMPLVTCAMLSVTAVTCDITHVAGDPRVLAAEEGSAFAQLLKAVGGAA